MKSTIILIGPLGVGKTTVGCLLTEKLGIPQCSLDEVRWKYCEEIDYDKELAARLFQSGKDFPEKLSYGKPFEVHAIERDWLITATASLTLESASLCMRIKHS